MGKGNSIWWTIIGIAVIAGITFLIIAGNPNGGGLATGEEYRSEEYGFSFSVPSGHEVVETEPQAGERYIMLLPENYMPPENGEGPPIVSVHVIPADSPQDIDSWVRENSASNFSLALTPLEEASISGAPAVSYRYDGLYPTRVVALMHEGNVIILSGSYLDPEDKVYSDFDMVVSSFDLGI